MEHNKELVKAVYHNAEMSKDIIGRMIKICDDPSLRAALAEEYAQYHEITCESKGICDEKGYFVKTKKQGKAAIFSGMAINTMINKSTPHLAEMMVQGSTMGVIDMKRALREYPGAEENVRTLAEKLMHTEQNNIKCMLEFV